MVPTSPTPITGYVILVAKEETIALDMTIEEAFRFIISAGVISPDSEPPILPSKAGGGIPSVAGTLRIQGDID